MGSRPTAPLRAALARHRRGRRQGWRALWAPLAADDLADVAGLTDGTEVAEDPAEHPAGLRNLLTADPSRGRGCPDTHGPKNGRLGGPINHANLRGDHK